MNKQIFVVMESTHNSHTVETGIIEADSFEEAISILTNVVAGKYPDATVNIEDGSARYMTRDPMVAESFRFGMMHNRPADRLNPPA